MLMSSPAKHERDDLSPAVILLDDVKRSLDDIYGEAGVKGAGMGGMWDYSNPFYLFESLLEGMGGMGGGMGSRGARSRAIDDFKEAVFGIEKEIEISRLESCVTCNGSGAKSRKSGSIYKDTHLGVFQQVMTCSPCNGTGEVSKPCGACSGDGRVRRTKRISLKVRAGVDSGSGLRVRGEGNVGKRGGSAGDLCAVIEVIPDPMI
ncbi:unnamed protein product [Eruca vesicaria subsp. sativa]|uniref:CR-type domain-containing protein n=1 Tax=Eruca vesicaria subsp. sativa TaxID=29727 RepID=A0ABC8KAL6_ERUVS|nr:unnamed protein product [Eruca vesicaria subsp. sativa]